MSFSTESGTEPTEEIVPSDRSPANLPPTIPAIGGTLTRFWLDSTREGDCMAIWSFRELFPGGCCRSSGATGDRWRSRTCARRDLANDLVGPLAHPVDDARTGGSRIVTGSRGQDEVGVHDAAFPLDWRMAHVQSARAVKGDVAGAGRERDRRQAPGVAEECGLDESPVGTGYDSELA
jgi:hypothetical protein